MIIFYSKTSLKYLENLDSKTRNRIFSAVDKLPNAIIMVTLPLRAARLLSPNPSLKREGKERRGSFVLVR
jgi:hypothetical protein